MTALLFKLVIDLVMRRFRKTLTLEYLDFVDDLAMLSHTHSHMHEKTSLSSKLNTLNNQVGLNIFLINKAFMTLNTFNHKPINGD